MNPIKIRGYKFLIEMGRITIDDVPEPYKSEIEKGKNEADDEVTSQPGSWE